MADLDGHLIYLNPALCRMLGEERPEDRIGQHLSIYYSEESNRRGKQEIEPVLKQQGYWEGELPMLSRQGKSVPTWHNTFIIRDKSGNPLRMAVVVTDITERKQAEEALRQSERRFRNYFEQGLIGMAVTSVDKRWLEVNDRLCEILGYSREELAQKTGPHLTYPDDVEPNLRLFNPLLAGEIEHFTLNKRYLKKDGSIVHATIHTRAFRKDDGTIDHIVTLVEDITARKQAEEALRRSEERLRLAQQVARVGTFEWNIQTGLNTWTPELEALYGLSPGGFPETEAAWENLVYSDDRAEALRLRGANPRNRSTRGRGMACGVAGRKRALAGRTLASLQGRVWQTTANDLA